MTRRVVVVIPVFNEAQWVTATVQAAATIPRVAAVIVADDGSTDRTSASAAEAGAPLVRLPKNQGKAAAMLAGAAAASAEGNADSALLFLDADIGATAATATPLVEPVLAGIADMTIAIIPAGSKGGGHGFVVRLAREFVGRPVGCRPSHCPDSDTFAASCSTRSSPLSRRFGVEVGMTIDARNREPRYSSARFPSRTA